MLNAPENRSVHPFLKCAQHSFVEKIGPRRVKFMHGHELDPIISKQWMHMNPLLRLFAGVLEFRSETCLVTCDAVSDVLCEIGEQCLRAWYGLTGQMESWASPSMLGLTDEKMTWLKRPIRTRNMLGRFYLDRQQGLYDVAVCGHTHKAGCFGNWYFNSGCWTVELAGLLRIDSEGQIGAFHWTREGFCENASVVMKSNPHEV